METNKTYEFKVGDCYGITENILKGSVEIECVRRTKKTATFEYCCDGKSVTKRIFKQQTSLYETEVVKFGKVIVTAF